MKEQTFSTFSIVVGLGIVGFVLWKSGLLKLTSKVAGAAETVVTDVMDLPQNVATIISLIPQIPLGIQQAMSTPLTQQSLFDAAIQGMIATFPGSISISQKTVNMIYSVYHRYTGVTAYNWAQVAVSHGAVFDASGYIVSDGGVSNAQAQTAAAQAAIAAQQRATSTGQPLYYTPAEAAAIQAEADISSGF
jgi:hypothetical protein